MKKFMRGANHSFNWLAALAMTLAVNWLLLCAGAVRAQDMEPRLYSNVPVGMNFAIASVSKSTGGLAVAASLPLENAELKTISPTLAYSHAFDAGGKLARVDFVGGWGALTGTAEAYGAPISRDINGLIDPVVRVSVNLAGAPALTLREFQKYRQDVIIGFNVAVVVPLGQYDPTRLLNLGGNRWIVQSELGVSKALGPVTIEMGQAIGIFSVNSDYLGGNSRAQDPIFTTKANIIFSFRPNISAAVQGLYFIGGQSAINGVKQDDRLSTSRVGATLTFGLNRYYSLKFFGSDGLSVRTGTSYTTFGTGLQVRWGAGL